MSFTKEFYLFLKERKKVWLLPMIVLLILLGIVITFATGAGSAVAPFIYTLF